ncbi:hypothetical protein QFC20_007538 [Naganishia adeliensis]|uniref:Uncharacterized protein n=1 Tax=Naganishia adeliensis TaxID=92952 RepID=A0ACC2UXK0_9TREE|nr:hypothetical protein QFC20_007538 [Naganishia adeliensis]
MFTVHASPTAAQQSYLPPVGSRSASLTADEDEPAGEANSRSNADGRTAQVVGGVGTSILSDLSHGAEPTLASALAAAETAQMEDMRAELAATRARMQELERSREEQAQALEVERQAREDAETDLRTALVRRAEVTDPGVPEPVITRQM